MAAHSSNVKGIDPEGGLGVLSTEDALQAAWLLQGPAKAGSERSPLQLVPVFCASLPKGRQLLSAPALRLLALGVIQVTELEWWHCRSGRQAQATPEAGQGLTAASA